MAIKAGQIIHAGNGTVVFDRIQTGGPGQLNIPTEKINELGNYKSVATIRDTPDLSFSMESFDVSTEVEAILCGAYAGRSVADGVTLAADATVTSATAVFVAADVGRQIVLAGMGVGGEDHVTTVASRTSGTSIEVTDVVPTAGTGVGIRISENGIDLATSLPIDIASQFKAGQAAPDPFDVVASIAAPFLYLEQMGYRFGLRDNATQTASLRGDTIFYSPGATFVEEVAGSGSPGQIIVTDNAAFEAAQPDERRVLAVTAGTKRLTFGTDYAETYGAETGGAAVTTVTLVDAVATTENVRIIYSSPATLTYPQNVHPDTTVKPAAVKGRDIAIYFGGYDPSDVAGSAANKLLNVQSVNLDWRVTLEKDEEFDNYYAVGQDFADVPTVNGSVDIKPRDAADLQALLAQLADVADPLKVLGTSSSTEGPLDIVIKNPEDGSTLKRLHVEDARFTPPGLQGRVQQKVTITMPFESDEGSLIIYDV